MSRTSSDRAFPERKAARAALLVLAASCAAGGVVRAERAQDAGGEDQVATAPRDVTHGEGNDQAASGQKGRESPRSSEGQVATSPRDATRGGGNGQPKRNDPGQRGRESPLSIDAGCFQLGPATPFHVLVPREACLLAYRIDRTEVTVAQYQQCIDAGACKPPPAAQRLCNANRPGRGQHPANCVAYEDAAGYCKWRGARLPSPDEWERAARGPRSATYPWGERKPAAQLVVGPRSAEEMSREVTTAPVCSTPRGNSAEGVCDLAGNVAEWVAGYWGDSGLWPTEEPKAGEALDGGRMTRGGSFGEGRDNLRAWMRQRVAAQAAPSIRNGFRCAEDR